MMEKMKKKKLLMGTGGMRKLLVKCCGPKW